MKTRYIAAVLLAVLTTALLVSSCKKSEYKREITEFGSFPFAEADFDENIYEDSEYMAKERALRYTSDDGTSVLISDERYTDYGDGDDALFFAKYLKSIIDGDAELYRSYHTERRRKNIPSAPKKMLFLHRRSSIISRWRRLPPRSVKTFCIASISCAISFSRTTEHTEMTVCSTQAIYRL